MQYAFHDSATLMDYLDQTFGRNASNLATILQQGLPDPLASEASLALPATIDAQTWTAMLWDDWNELIEAGEEDKVKLIMQENFPGLADEIAAMEGREMEEMALAFDDREDYFINYFSGFNDLEGWLMFERAAKALGLRHEKLLLGVGDGQFAFGIILHTPDQSPLLTRLSTSQPDAYRLM